MPESPTSRSLAYLRERGYVAEKVEYYNPFSKRRVDLFGCIDIVAVKAGEAILGVQATTVANQAARKAKALSLPGLQAWLGAGGRFEVHGWGKHGLLGKRKTWDVTVWRRLEDVV